MTPVGVIVNEIGNLGITAQLEGMSREVEVPFESLFPSCSLSCSSGSLTGVCFMVGLSIFYVAQLV